MFVTAKNGSPLRLNWHPSPEGILKFVKALPEKQWNIPSLVVPFGHARTVHGDGVSRSSKGFSLISIIDPPKAIISTRKVWRGTEFENVEQFLLYTIVYANSAD